MSNLCTPACNDEQIRTYPIPCKTTEATLKGGGEVFILLDCDVEMVSVADAVEWTALKTAEKFIVSPKRFVKLPKPETKREKLSACGSEQTVDETMSMEFYTQYFDTTTFTHFDMMEDMKNLVGSKTLLWIGCDGNLYYRYYYATGENPGFGGLSSEVFLESEVDNLQKLNINFKWNSYQEGIKAIPLTPALITAILD